MNMKKIFFLSFTLIIQSNFLFATSFSSKELDQFDGEYIIDQESNILEFKAFSNDERLANFKVSSNYAHYDYFETNDSYSAQIESYNTKTSKVWNLYRDFFPFLKSAGLAENHIVPFEFVSRFPIGNVITTKIKGMDPNLEIASNDTNILSLPELPIKSYYKCYLVLETGKKSAEFKEISESISIDVTETLNLKFVDSSGSLNPGCLSKVITEFKNGIKSGKIVNELSLYSPIHDAIIGIILTNFPSILGEYESGEVKQRLDARKIPSITHIQVSRTLRWNKL